MNREVCFRITNTYYKNYEELTNLVIDERLYKPKGKVISHSEHMEQKEQGRNSLCKCGSGKKFKKCCR